jgi:hypothetical protein
MGREATRPGAVAGSNATRCFALPAPAAIAIRSGRTGAAPTVTGRTTPGNPATVT